MPLCRGGDGGLIRDLELESAGTRSDAFRGSLPVLKVARPDERDEAVRHEILCDLKTDSQGRQSGLTTVGRSTGGVHRF
jgi:hypothetical protein